MSAESKRRFKFTRASVEALPVPTKAWVYYYDTVVPSLAVGIGPGGARTFVLIKKIAGRAERVKLERMSGGFGVDQARDAARAQLDRLSAGINPAEARRAMFNGRTLREVYEHFKLNRRSPRSGDFLSPKTLENYNCDFKNHLARFHGRRLTNISNGELKALHLRIGREHKHTANHVIALARSIFSHAKEFKFYEGENPARGIEPFPEPPRERFLLTHEWPRFAAELAATDEPWRWMFALAVFTGVRSHGVVSARWPDIDLPGRAWRVPAKGNKFVTHSLSPEAIDVFEQIPRVVGSDYVFPTPHKQSKQGHLVAPKRAWAALLKRAGFAERLTFHDLRRTHGSWQATTGASLPIIGKSLGHTSARSTEIYARLALEPVRESVQRATDAMLDAAKGDRSPAAMRDYNEAMRAIFGPNYKIK